MLDQNIFENDIDIHDLQKIGKILQFRIDETQNKYMGLYKYERERERTLPSLVLACVYMKNDHVFK